jgi:hypothetical protein
MPLISISKTLYKRLARLGGTCDACWAPINIHGGHTPCPDAHMEVDVDTFGLAFMPPLRRKEYLAAQAAARLKSYMDSHKETIHAPRVS